MTNEALKHDVAQMVMPRLEGTQLDDPRYLPAIESLIREGIGGFILFGGSLEKTPAGLQELQTRSSVPLLISSDIERGLGQQLVGGTRFPGQRAIASAINPRSRADAALLDRMLDAVRIESRAAGIHILFSPVVDVNNNPENPIICTRAFGEEPRIVEWFGSRYIKRLQKPHGRGKLDVLACAKHFPGHGDTDQDSHSVLPVIKAAKPRLNRVELPPFREAIKDGVAMVMVAHLLVPALEPSKPTTFSKKTITALLREGMDFKGLIISDALDMGALGGIASDEEIAVRAVEAGMDILLHPRDPFVTIRAVVAAVEQGRLTHQRIRESVDRIMAAKRTLGLFDKKEEKTRIDYEKHRRIAAEIAANAVTIVSAGKKALPLNTEGGTACFVLDDDNQMDSGDPLIREMREQFPYLSVMVLSPNSDMPESLVLDSIAAAESVVIAFFSKISASKGRSTITDSLRERALHIMRAAKSARAKSVVISFDSPYLLELFKDADVRMAAYDRMPEIQQAVVTCLAAG